MLLQRFYVVGYSVNLHYTLKAMKIFSSISTGLKQAQSKSLFSNNSNR